MATRFNIATFGLFPASDIHIAARKRTHRSIAKKNLTACAHMIAFLALLILLIAGFAAFPTMVLRKQQRITWWDYVYPFAGVVAWLCLSGVGSTVSLSNMVVEIFWIAVLSVVIPWVRWGLSKIEMKRVKALSFLLTLMPILAAAVIRLTMPTLPE
jgi:hypothetical protein